MMKEVLAIVISLTISLVSFGKTQTFPLQTESPPQSFTPEMTEIPSMRPASNTNKRLNTKEILCQKIIWVVEDHKKCNKFHDSSSGKRENHCDVSEKKNMTGKQFSTLLSKKMANLLYEVSVEKFSMLRVKTDSVSGTKGDPSLFISYYPGLLNEKIL